ncbi:MAG: YwaF family protein [Clostridia bacterium]|nr:YwaF family protein [Clostridia bacterium]
MLREFFGYGGYTREPEGYFSWQHILFVTSLMALMIALAVILGLKNRKKDEKTKNRVLIASAIAIDAVEIIKIAVILTRTGSWEPLKRLLPLFLCSIMLIALPLAAFSRGRLKEASLDFVFIFGLLTAFLGTYGAGQNYSCYPVLSLDNVASGLTHAISGFASLYIAVSGMASMKKKNIPVAFAITVAFCAAAYAANVTLDYNYMFLMRGDGTPYDIFYNLVNGSPVLYPLTVVGLFLVYIVAFYLVYYLCRKKKNG